MEIIRGVGRQKKKLRKTVVTVGVFDGIHAGHQKIISEVVKCAKRINGMSIVVTFDPHPSRTLSDIHPPLLLSLPKKLLLLEQLGIEACLIINFNRRFSELSHQDFVKKIIVEYLKAKLVVVGFNYVFGKSRGGNAQVLSSMGKRYRFNIIEIKPVRIGREIVSSTRIRELLKKGNIVKANSFLGHPYEITGTVEKGERRGHLIGHPTANLGKISGVLPAPGVYAGLALVSDNQYRAVLNIGWKPTFSQMGIGGACSHTQSKDQSPDKSKASFATTTAEVHILDFNRNIYGKKLSFSFFKRIRNEIAFHSSRELERQIEKDIKSIRSFHFHPKNFTV